METTEIERQQKQMNLTVYQINNINMQKKKKSIQTTFEHGSLYSLSRIYSMDKKNFKEIVGFT